MTGIMPVVLNGVAVACVVTCGALLGVCISSGCAQKPSQRSEDHSVASGHRLVAESMNDFADAALVIADPTVLQSLDASGFALARVVGNGGPDLEVNPLVSSLASIGTTLSSDIATIPAATSDRESREFLRDRHADRTFSRELLLHRQSYFRLVGIINRMDRGYRHLSGGLVSRCGEVRLIYRFVYRLTGVSSAPVSSPLPFTMAVVLSAGSGASRWADCARLARDWKQTSRSGSIGELTNYLESATFAEQLKAMPVDRIEVNLQVFRIPAAAKPDFGGHAEYVLRTFRRLSPRGPFVPSRLENQVSTERLLRFAGLRAAFRRFVLSDRAIADLDRGTLDVPWRFLDDRAISVSPGGMSRSANDPFRPLLDDSDIQAALDRYEGTGRALRRVRSVSGFRRRLADLSCSGCHQTRAIAGFHFPGTDPPGADARNAIQLAASAQFYADLPRRRRIVDMFAGGGRPDFSIGFSGRPDEQFHAALSQTSLAGGWATPCYDTVDRSFSSWRCAEGLVCRVLFSVAASPQSGVCVTAGLARVGDPVERGEVVSNGIGGDSYRRTFPDAPSVPSHYVTTPPPADRADYLVLHQGFRSADLTGGFPGGALAIEGCDRLPREASCGRLADTGFNKCIASGDLFIECLNLSKSVGLRSCSKAHPCREDYVCSLAGSTGLGVGALGTCVPPYSLFQFRVDGHPKPGMRLPVGNAQVRR